MRSDNRTTTSPFASAQNVSTASGGSYAGAYTDRQSRFEARSARRWGDWSILEFPIPLLWLYDEPWLCVDDECEFEPPVVIDLWG